MIWYNNIEAADAIRRHIDENHQGSHSSRRSRASIRFRGLRLVSPTDNAARW